MGQYRSGMGHFVYANGSALFCTAKSNCCLSFQFSPNQSIDLPPVRLSHKYERFCTSCKALSVLRKASSGPLEYLCFHGFWEFALLIKTHLNSGLLKIELNPVWDIPRRVLRGYSAASNLIAVPFQQFDTACVSFQKCKTQTPVFRLSYFTFWDKKVK